MLRCNLCGEKAANARRYRANAEAIGDRRRNVNHMHAFATSVRNARMSLAHALHAALHLLLAARCGYGSNQQKQETGNAK
jgi:hypothetical protein